MEPADSAFCGCGVPQAVQFMAAMAVFQGLLASIQFLVRLTRFPNVSV